jgi:hypothetical protein
MFRNTESIGHRGRQSSFELGGVCVDPITGRRVFQPYFRTLIPASQESLLLEPKERASQIIECVGLPRPEHSNLDGMALLTDHHLTMFTSLPIPVDIAGSRIRTLPASRE